ncbi:hypothetical protein Tco_0125108, partial [Tanacetum coccineum]
GRLVSKLLSLEDEELLGYTNYNMHSIRKMIAELHAMLKLHEKGIPKKAETPALLAIREGKIQKDKKKGNRAGQREVGHWRRNSPSYQAELKKRKDASMASTLGTLRKEDVKTWSFKSVHEQWNACSR